MSDKRNPIMKRLTVAASLLLVVSTQAFANSWYNMITIDQHNRLVQVCIPAKKMAARWGAPQYISPSDLRNYEIRHHPNSYEGTHVTMRSRLGRIVTVKTNTFSHRYFSTRRICQSYARMIHAEINYKTDRDMIKY